MMVLMQTLLPEPVAPAISTWGILARSATTGRPRTSRPSAIGSALFSSALRYSLDSSRPRKATTLVSPFGTSMPITGRPGTGASTRIDGAESASARSLARRVMRFTRTRVRPTSSDFVIGWPSSSSSGLPSAPRSAIWRVLISQPGSMPNCVTVGPRLISATRASTPNEASVSMMICALSSALAEDMAGRSGSSSSIGGKRQPSDAWRLSVRFAGGGSGSGSGCAGAGGSTGAGGGGGVGAAAGAALASAGCSVHCGGAAAASAARRARSAAARRSSSIARVDSTQSRKACASTRESQQTPAHSTDQIAAATPGARAPASCAPRCNVTPIQRAAADDCAGAIRNAPPATSRTVRIAPRSLARAAPTSPPSVCSASETPPSATSGLNAPAMPQSATVRAATPAARRVCRRLGGGSWNSGNAPASASSRAIR